MAQDQPLAPTIFVVGDRKQSIYGFRDADARVLARAAVQIRQLRDEADVSRAIRQSFRAVPPLLAFTNDLCDGDRQAPGPRRRVHLRRARRVSDPEASQGALEGSGALGARLPPPTSNRRPPSVADEIARLLATGDRARSADGRRPAGGGRRRRDPLSHPRRASGVPARARGARHPQLRLQGPRVLRRRRSEGRLCGAALSGQSRVGPAGRGVPAVALRPTVGCRAGAPRRPGSRRPWSTPDRERRRSRRRRPRGPRRGAPRRAGLAGPGRSRPAVGAARPGAGSRPPTRSSSAVSTKGPRGARPARI